MPDIESPTAVPMLQVKGLVKEFRTGGAFGLGGQRSLMALKGVDLHVDRGEWLGLVGESGSGKSTLARIVAGLETATSGSVVLDGQDITTLSRRDRQALSQHVQFVYQDAIGALNPRMTAEQLVSEPLRIHGRHKDRALLQQTVTELLGSVGLDRSLADKRPRQLSGGQCQRITLARALALEPDVLLLDEPTSALDVSVQAQIIELLKEIERSRELTVLIISHDLALVSQICQRVAVMYLGELVEVGTTGQVIGAPQHPYTRRLLDAVPQIS